MVQELFVNYLLENFDGPILKTKPTHISTVTKYLHSVSILLSVHIF